MFFCCLFQKNRNIDYLLLSQLHIISSSICVLNETIGYKLNIYYILRISSKIKAFKKTYFKLLRKNTSIKMENKSERFQYKVKI